MGHAALRARRIACACLAVACTPACLAGTAAAQAPVTAFSATYRAYNVWDDWKWWQPDKCVQTQPVAGFEPAATGRHPVVVYLHGALADWAGNAEGQAVARAAAGEGFVAAAVSYDSAMATGPAVIDGNAKCVFSPDQPANVLAPLCARPKADCSRGVLVAGFSAGGAVAGRAANFSSRVRAAWLIGVSGPAIPEATAAPAGTRALADARLRVTVGRGDVERRDAAGLVSADLTALRAITGSSCTGAHCLRADGSGFYIVEHGEVADGVADHCFWMRVNLASPADSCTTAAPPMDPGFKPPATTPWSLRANLAWLRTRLG
jgi:hypothetical protein